MENTYFTIVIPSYNRAHVLKDTIKSVQNQTFENWECIVVDDGSTDNTKEVIESIEDARVKYIYQDNAERSAARNNGAKNALGTYVICLDSDDTFETNHLSVLQASIEKSKDPKAMFFVNANHIIEEQKIIPEVPILGDKTLDYLLANPIIPARTCIHKDIFNDFGFDTDIVIVEDLVLWLKIASKFPIYHVAEYTVNYHLHPDNSINLKNNSYLNRLQGLKLFKKRYSSIFSSIPSHLWNKTISNTVFGIAKHHMFHKRFVKAALYTKKAIFFDVKNKQTKHRIKLLLYLSFFRFFNVKSKVIEQYL